MSHGSPKFLALPAVVAFSLGIVPVDARAESATATVATAGPEAGAASEAASAPWYESFEVGAFVDTYFFWSFNQPALEGGYTLNRNPLHTFEVGRGFGLSQAGLDIAYPAQPVGATLTLRFGPGAERFGGFSPVGETSLEMLKQAFGTWAPTDAITIDVGRFDTIYGAEVTESHRNMNYTRGIVWFNQPATHTGVRLGYAITPEISATLLAVNGWNNVIDNNDMKSFGAQVSYGAGPLKLILGALFGPEQEDNNETMRLLVDLIATYELESMSLLLNADYLHEDGASNAGAMLGVRVPFSDLVAVAGRGEFYSTDLAPERKLEASGTLTLDLMPASLLLIRAEGRLDYSNLAQFPTKSGEDKKTEISALVSMVVKTN